MLCPYSNYFMIVISVNALREIFFDYMGWIIPFFFLTIKFIGRKIHSALMCFLLS